MAAHHTGYFPRPHQPFPGTGSLVPSGNGCRETIYHSKDGPVKNQHPKGGGRNRDRAQGRPHFARAARSSMAGKPPFSSGVKPKTSCQISSLSMQK